MLTLGQYKMNRDILYPEEWTLEVNGNALDLIKRVNNLFIALKIPVPPVTSGFRPWAINAKVGGAKRSLHAIGKAVDLSDPGNHIGKDIIQNHSHLLLDYGIWLENPEKTPNWLHADTGIRSDRLIRVFNP